MSDMWIILRNSKGKEKKSHFPTKAKKKKKNPKTPKNPVIEIVIFNSRSQSTGDKRLTNEGKAL